MVRIAIMVMSAVALEAAMVAEIFDLITVSAFVMPSISTLALVLLFLLLVLTLKWVLALAHFVVSRAGSGRKAPPGRIRSDCICEEGHDWNL